MDVAVYDAAALSRPGGLTVQSVSLRSGAINVPDLSRGRWRTHQPPGIVRA